MKNKILYVAMLCGLFFTTNSIAQLSGKKLFIDPGHGGFTANDRNIVTIPYAAGNQNGFWESTANLRKSAALQTFLQNAGATCGVTRTSTSQDPALSTRAAAANNAGAEYFISIHSNAGGGGSANYLLILYASDSAGSAKYSLSPTFGNNLWDKLFDNPLTPWTAYSLTNRNVRADYPFYGYNLGVLNPLTRPGVLTEGSFHDYKPETHRLLSSAYCKMEAYNMFRGICTRYGVTPTKGAIIGTVKDQSKTMTDSRYTPYKSGTSDQYTPINGAKAELLNSTGTSVLQTYNVDNNYNGVFGFFDIAPGAYQVRLSANNYSCKTVNVTVTAGGLHNVSQYMTAGTNNCTVIEEQKGVLTLNLSAESGVATPALSTTQAPGKTVYLHIKDASGAVVNRLDCTLTSSNTSVATISVYGTIVTGSTNSTTTIKAVKGNSEGTLTLTVSGTPSNNPLRLVIGNSPTNAAPYTPLLPEPVTITAGKVVWLGIDGNNNPTSPLWLSRLACTLTSSDPGVATVEADGTITGIDNGTTTIKAVNSGREGSINLTVTGGTGSGGGPGTGSELTANGQLTLKVVAYRPGAVSGDPEVFQVPADTQYAGCLFISDTGGSTYTVTRGTPTTYISVPSATVSQYGTFSTTGILSGLLTIKVTNGTKEGLVTLQVGDGLPPVNIVTIPEQDGIDVFNTATGITIQFEGDATIELYTFNGILLDKVKASQSYSRDLNKGLYILRINDRTIKFVK